MNTVLLSETREPYSLLVVDDDEIAVEAARRALARLGVTNALHVAYDGAEALGALEGGAVPPPQLVLLDLRMPRMGGLELLGRLRASAALAHVPVIVISSSTHRSDREAVEAAGAAFIGKGGADLAERLGPAIGRLIGTGEETGG